MKRSNYLIFFIGISIFLILPLIYFIPKLQFGPVGDNITYLLQADSIYYDHDFVLNRKDVYRFQNNYAMSLKKFPIISKRFDKHVVFAKPVMFTSYLAFFGWLKNPIYRATLSNGILLLLILFIAFVILQRKLKGARLVVMWSLLLIALFVSQMPFYLPQIHPELFFNFLVIMSALPLIIDADNKLLLVISSLFGGILIFEKQLASFFPLIVFLYLIVKKEGRTQNLKVYLTTFIITVTTISWLNIHLHGNLLPYQGVRGIARLINTEVVFHGSSNLHPFTFPLNYSHRLLEFFLGKNIGIFVYNNAFLLFLGLSFYFIYKKHYRDFLLFIPPLIYLLTYFIAVDPVFSYGGGTSLGNRYFFQIYIYILLVVFVTRPLMYFKKKILLFFTVFLVLISTIVYLVPFKVYTRAIIDHLNLAFGRKRIMFFFPTELSYYQPVLTDLRLENRVNDKIFIINGNQPVVQENNLKWIPRGKTEIIEVSNTQRFTLPNRVQPGKNHHKTNSLSVKKVRWYKTKYWKHDGPFVAEFIIECTMPVSDTNQEKCAKVK